MNFKSSVLLGLVALSVSINSVAETTDVFCATVDGNAWDWLYEEDGSYTEVEGEWGRSMINPLASFVYFDLSQARYQELQRRCDEKEMVAQPANDRFSDWAIFRVQLPSGKKVFTRGMYSIDYDFRL
ncbi:hypothetical protein BCS71_23125 [Vibrio lentus]|uniref:hypothetical protein n=1 Tax=Vibrio TaxID=662 RepID=UPI0003798828|nr:MULTISPECIES: hypothetical protein [Vibrio]OCH64818.1 hypothetical protein A6E08_14650 [Vibrio lentus]PMI61230.1 hypothetical protein BCU41_16900 [Vibrio lentus]PMI88148.1 hypothetical protein BCU35_10615 [Vibrio lentus]